MDFKSMRACGIAAALLGLAGACAGTPEPTVGLAASQPAAASGQDGFGVSREADYRLRPSDSISVSVYREPELSLVNVPVGADGMIAVPLAGPVHAAGRTPGELAAEIAQALRGGFLNNPQVAVNVLSYGSHEVTVEGAVTTPGVFPFKPGARLSSAIALAQGPKRVAKLDRIAVFRESPQGLTVAKFDYRAMQQGTMIDPLLMPGDRVVVGTSGLSQFYQDVLQAVPTFGLFANVVR